MGWSISPSDLARIDNNGNVTFSKHTERDITYTITYSDSNFTCTKACTVHKCAEACTCANANLNAAVAPDGVDIPASGYTSSKTIGTYNFSTCLTAVTASSDQGWITDIIVGSGNITAKANENTSIESGRTATITVTGKDSENNDCTGTFTVTQLPSATTCTCDVFTVSPIEGCVPVSAGTNNIGTYTDGGCVTDIAAYNLPDWLSSVNFSNGTISGTVTKNEGTAKRETTISVSGSAAGDTCTRDLYVCQEPGDCVTGITYAFPSRTIPCDADNHITVHAADGNITITTTYIDAEGKCATSSDTITNKSIWCPGDSYCIPANDTGSDRPFSYDVYLVGTSLYLGSGAGGTMVGTISGTQLKCASCNEGTDNTCLRGSINWGWEAGAHEYDVYINGLTTGCITSFSKVSGDIDVSATIDNGGGAHILYQLDSSNYDPDNDLDAVYRITISDSCTGGTNNLCKSWDVCFHQSKCGCGCSDLMWTAGEDTPASTATSCVVGTFSLNACFDDYEGSIEVGADWVDEVWLDWSTPPYKVMARFSQNTTGSPRYAKFKIVLGLTNGGECEQYPEITQQA